jgi:hypothetical protein
VLMGHTIVLSPLLTLQEREGSMLSVALLPDRRLLILGLGNVRLCRMG